MMKDWVGPMFSDLALYMALGAEGMLQDWSGRFTLSISESATARRFRHLL